jgi:formate-dependent nitrite reductase membrane component NrfD
MTELTTTRANELIDPTLHVWGWEIPVYLFLGGLVAGMMVISGYFLFSGRYKNTSCSCYILPGLGIVLLSLGMFALFLDLEHKLYFWRLYTTFKVFSPMSWGAWILMLVYPALLANFLLRVPPFVRDLFPGLGELSDRLLAREGLVKWIGALNMIFGGLLGVYTGILLSTLGARPLWNSSLLGPLFLVSGMSAAAAFVHMIAREREERELLAKADNGLLLTELVLMGLFLIGLLTATRVHAEAASLFLGGPYTAFFWVFVVLLGIVIPLFIQLLAVNHRIRHQPLAPVLVILGGVLLRFVIVNAGQISRWSPV